MATYKYLAYDLRSNALVAELPLAGVSFNTTLNKIGSLSGKVPTMSDPGNQKAQLASLVIPGRTALFVDRDRVLVWGGVIWQSQYRRQDDSLTVSAQTFMSYFKRRRRRSDASWTNSDQLTAAQDLINGAQSVSGGNIGVVVPATTSGVLISANFFAYERRVIADEVNTFSQAANGFDYEIDSQYVSGVPVKTFNTSYPRRGRIAGSTGLLFENPGNVTDYTLPNDATRTAFTVDVSGAGNGQTALTSTAQQTAYLDAGWPLLEDVVPYKGTNDQNQLNAYANAQVTTLGQPSILPTVVVDPGQDPILGSYITGDEARFRLRGPMWSGILDTYYRIIDIAVRPQEGGQHESATLTLGPTVGH